MSAQTVPARVARSAAAAASPQRSSRPRNLAQPGLGLVGLMGVAAVFTFVALAASFVVPLRAAWARVVVRVVGSWIAAIGLLLIGWGMRSSA